MGGLDSGDFVWFFLFFVCWVLVCIIFNFVVFIIIIFYLINVRKLGILIIMMIIIVCVCLWGYFLYYIWISGLIWGLLFFYVDVGVFLVILMSENKLEGVLCFGVV